MVVVVVVVGLCLQTHRGRKASHAQDDQVNCDGQSSGYTHSSWGQKTARTDWSLQEPRCLVIGEGAARVVTC